MICRRRFLNLKGGFKDELEDNNPHAATIEGLFVARLSVCLEFCRPGVVVRLGEQFDGLGV
jgi:hypothetical protein